MIDHRGFRFRIPFSKLAVFSALSGLALLSHGSQAADLEAIGDVVSVQGKVLVREDGKKSGAAAAAGTLRPGDMIFKGQVINTASNSRVKILLRDKSIVDLGPNSLIHVEHYLKKGGDDREVDLNMKYGLIRAAVSRKLKEGGRFRVRAPAATMGVRGTEFVVKSGLMPPYLTQGPGGAIHYAPPKAEVFVLQGQVKVFTHPVIIPGTPGLKFTPPPSFSGDLSSGQRISAGGESEGPTKLEESFGSTDKKIFATSPGLGASALAKVESQGPSDTQPSSSSNGNAPDAGQAEGKKESVAQESTGSERAPASEPAPAVQADAAPKNGSEPVQMTSAEMKDLRSSVVLSDNTTFQQAITVDASADSASKKDERKEPASAGPQGGGAPALAAGSRSDKKEVAASEQSSSSSGEVASSGAAGGDAANDGTKRGDAKNVAANTTATGSGRSPAGTETAPLPAFSVQAIVADAVRQTVVSIPTVTATQVNITGVPNAQNSLFQHNAGATVIPMHKVNVTITLPNGS